MVCPSGYKDIGQSWQMNWSTFKLEGTQYCFGKPSGVLGFTQIEFGVIKVTIDGNPIEYVPQVGIAIVATLLLYAGKKAIDKYLK